jgi:hypothetical protein
LPLDSLKNRTEFISSSRINAFDKCDPAQEMRAEARMCLAILTFRASVDTISQNRFKPIEVASPDIDPLVRYYSRQVLARAVTHDAGLAMMDGKSFLLLDCRYMRRKPAGASRKILAA